MITKISNIIGIFGVIFSFVFVQSVHADEIVINGNSAGSTNEINITITQTNTVEQNNTAKIDNNVEAEANTGNNTASDNASQETSIETGAVTQEIAIENNANTNHVDNTCCTTTTMSLKISENGRSSTNTIDFVANGGTSVTSNNNATIVNNISGSANTGGNQASNNTGNVSIETGKIYVKEYISTTANKTYVKAPSGNLTDFTLFIVGNARDSINTINTTDNTTVAIDTTNLANIVNESFWNLVSGNNEASDNAGNVDIKTGDIYKETVIKTAVNISEVEVSCCPKPVIPPVPEEPTTPPPPVVTVSNPPTGGGSGDNGGGNGGSSSGDILGAAIGELLPATGSNFLFLALFGNVMLFLLGAILRLRSGRAPALAYA